LVENFGGMTTVKACCEMAAEAAAKYGTPTLRKNWLYPSFGKYYDGDHYVKTGVVIEVEPNAQYQNAFGAMANSTVTCSYDLHQGKVIGLEVTPK
jgi:hypothetical protein